jgi:Protein of unknown function (DUF2721)
MNKTLTEIIPVLQIAIIPVILISGVSLLLLTITNRFGRVCDRARMLAGEIRNAPDHERQSVHSQIAALFRRVRYLRAAATFASLSMLGAAALVITLFGAAMFDLEIAAIISLIFVGSMGALAASIVSFLRDLNLSLLALGLDLKVGEVSDKLREARAQTCHIRTGGG